MRLTIIAVGRAGRGPERALYDHYAKRLRWPLTLKEVELRGRRPAAETPQREAELIRAAMPAGAVLVALDERGKALSSTAFADALAGWRDGGVQDIALVIGGAEGLDESLRSEARLVLSLGPMTWPHLMVRGMLAEQLYRAQQILAGHPYHREG